MNKYNSMYVEVRGLAHGRGFEIGPIKSDKRGTYRTFTIHDPRHPWQGILEHGRCDGKPGWYYLGECWTL